MNWQIVTQYILPTWKNILLSSTGVLTGSLAESPYHHKHRGCNKNGSCDHFSRTTITCPPLTLHKLSWCTYLYTEKGQKKSSLCASSKAKFWTESSSPASSSSRSHKNSTTTPVTFWDVKYTYHEVGSDDYHGEIDQDNSKVLVLHQSEFPPLTPKHKPCRTKKEKWQYPMKKDLAKKGQLPVRGKHKSIKREELLPGARADPSTTHGLWSRNPCPFSTASSRLKKTTTPTLLHPSVMPSNILHYFY